MQDAMVNGQLIQADPDSPEKAQCPSCGGTVTKRKRRRMDGTVAHFYRHDRGKVSDVHGDTRRLAWTDDHCHKPHLPCRT
ncbi:MAG: hypothetical protein GY832_25340 [Chloroflexi bacterium]|nr:hypothetical protein [Chloroflexota bacterium]